MGLGGQEGTTTAADATANGKALVRVVVVGVGGVWYWAKAVFFVGRNEAKS
jgi:hypothetical protein